MFSRLNQVRTALFSLAKGSSNKGIDASHYRSAMTSGTYPLTVTVLGLVDHVPWILASQKPEIATFAAGCFWGVEHIFLKHYPPSQNKGILKTAVGYTGGKDSPAGPSYQEVCSGTTNHAEALRIEFDPSVVSYDELVGEYPFTGHADLSQLTNHRVLLPHS
jgi:peptide-methionine (S)-S-oxide reductase